MHAFTYSRPGNLKEALEAFRGAGDGQFLAGGQTMIPVMKQRLAMPAEVIDLAGVEELTGITAGDDGVTIGAMTRHAEVSASKDVRARIPALAVLAGQIGDPHVRNRGTLGGSIANNDPSADYPAAVVGLGATVVTDRREIAGDGFFTDMFETALEPGELIVKVVFPIPEKAAYVKFPNPASRYAIVGVMASRGPQGIRVAVTGAGPCVFRVSAMEEALAADFSPDAIKDVAVPAEGLNADIHASAEYRAHLISVMAARAVRAAG